MDQDRDSIFTCRGFLERDPAPPAPPLPQTPGPEWKKPGDLPWSDQALAEAYRRSRGAFCRHGPEGSFSLAYPLDCRCPFPLPALFCFARAQCLGGRGWWVFSFGPDASPRFEGE